ncbi:alpha/beta fold hydrolase [Actinoplanes sp. NPDC051513]|uniref:alpha/beta fold hydrolase n=1 Tax=Actinoplanes sp. NPDC051513 TaxID=3363908 RepID=UPI0037A68AA5
MTEQDFDVRAADGIRLTVRRQGVGTPVVLVHGSGGGLHSWAPLAFLLAGSFELWMPARRGYGPSDVPPSRKSFKDEVGDLTTILDTIGRPAHLVGASYGATLALHTAASAPDSLLSVAVFEPPLFASGPAVVPLLDRYRAAFERNDAAEMFTVLNEVTRVPPSVVSAFAAATGDRKPDPAEARRSAIGWLHDLEALADDDPDPSRWSRLTVPTLLLNGGDTWEPMPTTMDALAGALPTARRITWPGQSHFAPSTAPGLMADALKAFFAEASA